MTNPIEAPKSIYYQAFVRDDHRCVYCDKDILESFDSFAASHLDHLKPRRTNGPDNDIHNRVTACAVCNSIKGGYDPHEEGLVTAESFAKAVAAARRYIWDRRDGAAPCSYHRDYHYWLGLVGRDS